MEPFHKKRKNANPINVTVGSAVVKIDAVQNRGSQFFTVVRYAADGTRRRKAFSDLNSARFKASEIATRLANGELKLTSPTAPRHRPQFGVAMDEYFTTFVENETRELAVEGIQ